MNKFKNAKYVLVEASVWYWEDAKLNGFMAYKRQIPCRCGDIWAPIIDIDSGRIINWENGIEANVHFKICNAGDYYLLDEDKNKIASYKLSYVPDILSIEDIGYGDYIIINISKEGYINNWKFSYENFELIK